MPHLNRAHLFAAATAAILLPGAPARAQATGDDTVGGEIVVTATKREARLLDVPLSISAITGRELEQRNLTRITDFASQIPGFSVQDTGAGKTRLVLRGQNTGGTGASVATMVDDVVVSSASPLSAGSTLTPELLAFDLDRIEVLRGPQGTLYGATAQGGLLHYVTAKPALGAFNARAEAGIDTVRHGGAGWIGQAMINVPVAEIAALRITGTYQDVAGFIDNPVLGEDKLGGGERYSVRGQLLVEPVDRLTVRLTASYEDSHYKGNNFVALNGGAGSPRRTTALAFDGNPTRNTYYPETGDNSFQLYNGVLTYDLGGVSLFSSTSYTKYKSTTLLDISESAAGPGVSLGDAFGAIYGQPVAISQRQKNSFGKFNQEIRLASKDDVDLGALRLNWQVGGFFTHEKIVYDQLFTAAPRADVTRPLTVPIAAGQSLLPAKYREFSGFGETTLKFGDQFELSLGGRYSTNRQHSQVTNLPGLIGSGGPFTIVNPEVRTKENKFTYSIAPRFIVTRDLSLYGRVATGYRPGGPVWAVPGAPSDFPTFFESDNTVNYEVGFKGTTADKVLTFDVATYRIDWTDIQLTTIFVSQTSGQQFRVQGNGGTARSEGVEFSFSVRPVRSLLLSMAGGYTNARLTKDAPGFGGRAGDKLPYVPKFQNALAADYTHRFDSDLSLTAGATLTYVGNRYSDFGATPFITNHVRLPDYTTIDLRAGVQSNGWSIQAYVRNLSDSQGLTNYAGQFARNPFGIIIPPRTIGVRLGVRY